MFLNFAFIGGAIDVIVPIVAVVVATGAGCGCIVSDSVSCRRWAGVGCVGLDKA